MITPEGGSARTFDAGRLGGYGSLMLPASNLLNSGQVGAFEVMGRLDDGLPAYLVATNLEVSSSNHNGFRRRVTAFDGFSGFGNNMSDRW